MKERVDLGVDFEGARAQDLQVDAQTNTNPLPSLYYKGVAISY
jgi:hypothetical protein